MLDHYYARRTRHVNGPGMLPVGDAVYAVRPREYETPTPGSGTAGLSTGFWGALDYTFRPFATPNAMGRIG